MLAVDEDLRHRGPPAGAASRLLTHRGAVWGIDFLKLHLLGGQDMHRPLAERAPGLSIDFDLRHLSHLCDGMSDHSRGAARATWPHLRSRPGQLTHGDME